MKATTRKITGPAMERLFRRVIADAGPVDGPTADHLARQLALIVTSARVRRVPLRDLSRGKPEVRRSIAEAPPPPAPVVVPASEAAAVPEVPAKFDPYQFGLVPVFQREGRAGLLQRLSHVTQPDHLRAMAKAQQIALDPALRAADASADQISTAIADAVEKRVADRRAAAS